MNGFINLNKIAGASSAYATGAVKKKFHIPCGHMGTLDPMASGVLPVGVGKASRLFPFLLDKQKTYVAEFAFGYSTDTLDGTGTVENTTHFIPSESEITSALSFFIGEYAQIPPQYSAKCVDGKRGYQLARKGVEFTLPPKTVCVNDFKLLQKTAENTYRFRIDCKGGTYVRSLCRDLAEKCGSLATMTALCRTKSGIFTLENSVLAADFISSTEPEKFLISADSVVDFEKLRLTSAAAKKMLDGVFENGGYKNGLYRVYSEDDFWGIGEAADGVLKMKAYVR